jgi:hypothetical protein
VIGPDVADLEKALDVELDGFAGSGLFATFRLTFAGGGRTLYVEDLPAEVIEARMRAAEAISRRLQEQGAVPDMKLSAPDLLDTGGDSASTDRMSPPPTETKKSDNPKPGKKSK